MLASAPAPSVSFTLCSNDPYSRIYLTTYPYHAGPRGGGLTLPAAAAAAPENASAQKGSEIEKNEIKETKRERARNEKSEKKRKW